MRIVCPNCDAQYEVPDEVVPDEGRDVQCSSCGQTWFQHHPDFAEDDADGEFEAETVMPEPEPLLEDEPAADEEVQETPIPPRPRKELDPEVADILREEAERETAARDVETPVAPAVEPIEVQQDLGLDAQRANDEEERRLQEMSDRMARMRGEQAEQPAPEPEQVSPEPSHVAAEAAATAAALGSRKDLLPDIEEINSTLRSTGDREVAGGDLDPEAPVRIRKKRGFRRGFLIALLIFVIAILIYIFAPQIAEAVPQSDPMLSSYVTWVDGLRNGLDGWLQGMLQWLDTKAAQSQG